MKYLLILMVLWSWTSPSEEKVDSFAWTKHKLIAHAAGGIKGKDYTNSEQAFRNSYSNGYKLIEIDLSLTSDGHLVARHGWDETYGQEFKPKNKALSYNKFIKLPYYLHYTPLDFERVIKLMEKHPEIYVLLDGKGTSSKDTEKLYKQVGEKIKDVDQRIVERLIPQMYYRDDIDIIRSYGFEDVLYIVGRENHPPESILAFCQKHDLRAVGISKARVNESLVEMLYKKGIVTYVYTINDLDEMYTFFEIDVHGFYTDYVIPEEIEELE
ncbi:glycerophosphodiester phosphodiesterase family protein [Jeotgalibacillus proteolyticus]|uniref:glycerophosphodiester phosphodiesterase family protein n=1 Tax=Jeotgalibacillus proteolyticus TaxID=2082395 RepID=UPI003CEFBEB6